MYGHVELFMYILRERISTQLIETAMQVCISAERYPFENEILHAMPWQSIQTATLTLPPSISNAMQIFRYPICCESKTI